MHVPSPACVLIVQLSPCADAPPSIGGARGARRRGASTTIDTLVVIFAENRSFDNLYGNFPGRQRPDKAHAASTHQLDRDGSVLQELPPIWGGLTAKGVTPPVTQAETEHLPNAAVRHRRPQGLQPAARHDRRATSWHRFYQNQMQIDGGKNDKFVAWADSGALVMGH